MLAYADIRAWARRPSDLELGGLDPLPEVRSARLLQVGRIHRLEAAERHEIVLVVVGGEALHEGLVGDVVLAPAALAAEALDLQPFDGTDDIVLARPGAALSLGGLLHRGLVGGDGEVGAIGLPVGIVLMRGLVPGHEFIGQGRGIGIGEIERVVPEQHALRRELLLHQGVLPAGRREHELRALGELGGVRLFHEHRQVREQERREDQVRLRRLERSHMAGQVHGADLGPLLGDHLVVDVEAFEQRHERRHVVAAVRIVRVDAGDGDELALPVLDRKQRGHDRLALVVGRAKQEMRVGDLLVDPVLGGAVPIDGERARLLDHRAEREADAGGDDAHGAVDLLLLHQLAEALDRILGRGLFLDYQLDLAAGDAAVAVEAFGRPLGGTDAVFARTTGDAGAGRQDADAQRLILGKCGRGHLTSGQKRAGGGGGFQQCAT